MHMPVERLTFTYRYTLGTIRPHFLLLLEIVNPQGCVSSVHVYSPSGYISFWLWPCIAICIVYLCIHYKNITVYVSDLAQHHSVSVYTVAGHFCDFFSQEENYSQAIGKDAGVMVFYWGEVWRRATLRLQNHGGADNGPFFAYHQCVPALSC